MTPLQRNDELRALAAKFREVLATACTERRSRPGIVTGPHGPELEWVVYERTQMLAAVNEELARRGQPAASVDAVLRAENQAAGHSDYARKYALYCAEIVMAGDPR